MLRVGCFALALAACALASGTLPAQDAAKPDPTDRTERVGFPKLRRAAAGPGVTETLVERLLDCVAEARGLACILNIPFEQHASEPARLDMKEVLTALGSTRFRKLTDNPRVIFFVLGYGTRIAPEESDEQGSLHRAEHVLRELRERGELGNAVYAFGLGGLPSLTGQRRAGANYVEVWALVP